MSADSIEKIADLLPCPFCGAAPLKTTTHRVFCANATCCLASKDWDCWPDQWNRRALPSLAELERDAGRYRLMAEHAEAKFQRAVRILTAIHSLLHPPLVTAPDGRTFAFKSPMLDEQVQALSDRIRAIPDELAAIDAARAKEGL